MERERPRWRLRLSTLMLLVVIAGLMSYIVVLWVRQARLEAGLQRALAGYERAQAAAAQQANAGVPATTGPTE